MALGLDSLTSLTGGGGLSSSSSATSGPIGGNSFSNGGINVEKTSPLVWIGVAAALLLSAFVLLHKRG